MHTELSIQILNTKIAPLRTKTSRRKASCSGQSLASDCISPKNAWRTAPSPAILRVKKVLQYDHNKKLSTEIPKACEVFILLQRSYFRLEPARRARTDHLLITSQQLGRLSKDGSVECAQKGQENRMPPN
jgi:hypothetical protein